MNPNICNLCGGDYEYRGGRWICRACGSYKPEELSNEEVTLLYTASQKLRLADFDEAEQAFDDIIQKYPRNPNGYWGRLMSKYGIKYEEDFDGRRIPTCYATSIESITSTSDYLAALQYADAENRTFYENQAAYIERVRKEWVERARKEKPYDIFICYKDSDLANGVERTWDSVATQDLYIHLCNKGYRVFYSRESLRDKVGEKYEPYIFNALSTAKVMLVYASKPEYITSTWLKNEWTRYQKRMAEGEKKPNSLLVACDGFQPSELPRALSSMQCLDANRRSFYGDLDEAIDRIISGKDDPAAGAVSPTDPASVQKPKRKKEPLAAAACVALAAALVGGWLLSLSKPDDPAIDSPGESDTADTEGPDSREPSAVCVHKITADSAVYPTCTEDGLSEGAHCELCGEILIPQEVRAALGHDIRTWHTEREPEIGADGSRYGTCHTCGERIYESIPAYSEGLQYTSNGDGTCLVSGLGHCSDQYLRISPVFEGEQVVGISELAFSECGHLTGITLPEGLISIGQGAFNQCHSLQEIYLPESLTAIGDWAFDCCVSLTELTLPASVSELGVGVFSGCANLTDLSVDPQSPHLRVEDGVLYSSDGTRLIWYSLAKEDTRFDIPEGVTTVAESAFRDCPYLTHLFIPRSVERIGDNGGSGGFFNCTALTEITVDEENPHLRAEDGVLYDKAMTVLKECPARKTSVRIPDTVRTIGHVAFDNCSDLIEIILPEELTVIESSAFDNCPSLQRVLIPDSVMQIDGWAFANCPNLSAVYYTGTEREWQAISIAEENHGLDSAEIFFNFTYSDHIHEEISDEAVEPTCTEEGMTEGRHCAVCGMELVRREPLPALGHSSEEWIIDREATIEEDGLRHGTCSRCGEEVSEPYGYFSEGLEYASNEDGTCTVIGLGTCTDSVLRIPAEHEGQRVTGIGDYAFEGCGGIEWVTLPEGMTDIGNSAFQNCDGLTGISLPESLTDIHQGAFSHCAVLTEVFIPVGVTFIHEDAFPGCGGLTHFSVDPNNEFYTDRDGVLFDESGTCLIQYPAGREESVYHIPEDVTRIRSNAFVSCRFLTEIHIPAGVTEIGGASFHSFEKAAQILVDPANTAYRSEDGVLFTADMTRLIACLTDGEDSVYRIPDGVTDLAEFAFVNACLTEIVIPDSVMNVWDFTFHGCISLERFTVSPDNPHLCSMDGILYTKNGTRLLRCPARKTSAEVLHGVSEIGNRAFDGCTELTELTLPYDMTRIGNNAFACCEKLTRITFSRRVEQIEQDAFLGCTSLQEILYTGSEAEWQNIRVEGGNEALDSATVRYHAAYGDHEHTERMDPAVDPTCTETGYTEGSHCSFCGEILNPPRTQAPAGHSVSEWIIDREAEPGVKGSRHGNCDVCGITVTETIKAYSVGLEYSSNGDGTCTVIGRGSCTDLHIRIPHAFEGERVTSIGEWAFGWCGDIIQVTIPEGVETIQPNAFQGCENMTLINLPESLTTIGAWAFADCHRLTAIYLPGGVEHLDPEALRGCYNLAGIAVSPDNPHFRDLEGVLFDKELTALIKYPSAREGDRFDVPESVTRLADWAFDDANRLTVLYIPYSVAEISATAINACQNLTAIEVDPDNQHYTSEDGILFTADRSTLVRYPIARPGETYSVPEDATSIGAWAFDGTHLTEIYIPASVEHVGEWAFHLCFELNAITVAEENQAYRSEDGLLYTEDLTRLLQCPIQKTEVTLPEGVKIIEPRAFEFCSLTELTLSSDVERIGDNAFAESQSLTRLVLPDSVVRIDYEAVRNCPALTEIGYMGSEADWQAVSVDENNGDFFGIPLTFHYRPLA